MKVRVYAPPFANHALLDEDGMIELPEGTTVNALLTMLRVPLRAAALRFCLVNWERAEARRVLREGDTVGFISVLSGG